MKHGLNNEFSLKRLKKEVLHLTCFETNTFRTSCVHMYTKLHLHCVFVSLTSFFISNVDLPQFLKMLFSIYLRNF